MVRMISMEARASKGVMSPGLKTAIDKAKAMNVPADNIERAVKKASESSGDMESVTYEAYGPGGVAVIIEALTTNRNKAAQEVKHILSNHGIALAGMGAAAWAFEKTHEGWVPHTMVAIEEADGEKLEALVDELEENDEVQEVFTNAE